MDSLALAACRKIDPIAAIGPLLPPAATVTYTPFQAASPTPRPTLTQTPTLRSHANHPTHRNHAALSEPAGADKSQLKKWFSEGRPPFVFRVYFPPCFGEDASIRYPVLYMIHGQTFNR